LLVVIGEFNSGKSTFLNAMLGKKWLQDVRPGDFSKTKNCIFLTPCAEFQGVTPTTSQVNVLRYGQQHSERPGLRSSGDRDPNLKEVELPVDWLKQISLVDTPGTNAVIAEHQQITEHFVPRSDMVLFVTSCDRAFTESERVFLGTLILHLFFLIFPSYSRGSNRYKTAFVSTKRRLWSF
jgi:GTPase SAR1 family protein